jgi:ElaB/YqjD/DUF883 family membrane-anchored ribosome-binding protein
MDIRAEAIRMEEKAFSENTRNALIYIGIGSAAGIGILVGYDNTVYSDVRIDFDAKTAQTRDLEKTADALAISSNHLESKGLIDETALVVMRTERTELIAEAQAIKKDTPNIVVEQLTWAGVGILPGIALGLGAWATHRRWKKRQ